MFSRLQIVTHFSATVSRFHLLQFLQFLILFLLLKLLCELKMWWNYIKKLHDDKVSSESRAKSTLSNWRSETHCRAVCKPTVSLRSTSHKGATQSVLARTNSPASFLMHIPNPTMLSDNDASILHLYLPAVGFFHVSPSWLIGACLAVAVLSSLQDLITWATLQSSNKWVARWTIWELCSFCCCQSFKLQLFQRLHIVVTKNSLWLGEICYKWVKISAWIL